MPTAPADSEHAVRVLRQFRIVFNAVRSHFQQVERESGLGGAQIWALSLIRERPGLGVNELAAALSVRQPTASNLVKGLVRLGLVEARREEAEDVREAVAEILAAVRRDGDRALLDLTERFDRVTLTAAGLRVPADISVTGFDDSLAARTTLPQLTTVRQPLRMMGMKAVESLLARIRQHQGQADHTEPKPIVFPVEVVVRASVRDIAAKK